MSCMVYGRQKPLRALSLGVGRQTIYLALAYEAGILPNPPDVAIFSDLKREPRAVYRYLDYLRQKITRFPIVVVSAGDVWESAIRVRTRRDGRRKYIETAIPVFLKDGLRRGKGQRHCTRDFKIIPIQRKCRELLGMRSVRKGSGVLVKMILGISMDEHERMKPSRVHYIENEYPLINEQPMTVQQCVDWVIAQGHPPPPRSACKECPLRDDESWAALDADEFQEAVDGEAQLQTAYAQTDHFRGKPYLHASRVPLSQVKLKPTTAARSFINECEGFCGV